MATKFLTNGYWLGGSSLNVRGGQAMTFKLTNRNVLGTTIRITASSGESQGLILLPLVTMELTFTMFGAEPMSWSFDISTESDVFQVNWELYSTWVPGDPANR